MYTSGAFRHSSTAAPLIRGTAYLNQNDGVMGISLPHSLRTFFYEVLSVSGQRERRTRRDRKPSSVAVFQPAAQSSQRIQRVCVYVRNVFLSVLDICFVSIFRRTFRINSALMDQIFLWRYTNDGAIVSSTKIICSCTNIGSLNC